MRLASVVAGRKKLETHETARRGMARLKAKSRNPMTVYL